MSEIEVSGPLVDPDFWDQCLLGIVVLVAGVVAALLVPSLLRRLSRPMPPLPDMDLPPATRAPGLAGLARRAIPLPPLAGKSGPLKLPVSGPPPAWSQQAGKWTEKRKHLRREGEPTRICLSVDGDRAAPIACEVTNRSRGGLGIVLDRSFAPGTLIEVRPADAPEDMSWVRLEVRNCRKQDDRWHIGCQFTEELPWSRILLFG